MRWALGELPHVHSEATSANSCCKDISSATSIQGERGCENWKAGCQSSAGFCTVVRCAGHARSQSQKLRKQTASNLPECRTQSCHAEARQLIFLTEYDMMSQRCPRQSGHIPAASFPEVCKCAIDGLRIFWDSGSRDISECPSKRFECA